MTDEQILALTDALRATARVFRTGQDPAAAADVIDRSVSVLAPEPAPAG